MTKKSLVLIVTLAAASLANAKSYTITLSQPSEAAGVELPAGDYSLKLQGTKATFTNINTGKSFATVANVETVGKKFDVTSVTSATKDGAVRITSVELGGSTTKLELGE
jgi:hypothetical protein